MPRRSKPRRPPPPNRRFPAKPSTIEFEDEKGQWHTETARGSDRPHTAVKDKG